MFDSSIADTGWRPYPFKQSFRASLVLAAGLPWRLSDWYGGGARRPVELMRSPLSSNIGSKGSILEADGTSTWDWMKYLNDVYDLKCDRRTHRLKHIQPSESSWCMPAIVANTLSMAKIPTQISNW